MVLRGEAGVGKSALLAYMSDRAAGWRVATAAGAEAERELAYSGLHQLCAPMLDHLDALPDPQREALATVFGRSAGPPPDRFLTGLATLTLIAEVGEQQPLVCIVDDAQWLDATSAQILGFVARRLLAERAALVCAARTVSGDDVLAGLPELAVEGLGDSDSRALLLENVRGPLDAAVCDQIVTESHGNPLALLELPRTWNAADLAGGFGLPDNHHPVVGKIEESYARRVLRLPPETRLLVVAAAAEPLGDPVLLHRAAETLGLDMAAADPAVDAGLLKIGGRVEFAHPLVRSAAYHSALADDRHRVHRALAEATDAATDPDRRAWHRARATPGPGEEVAAELERSAGRAQARGGLAAAAAFLQRAVALTADPARRVERALAAAQASLQAGAFDAALGLVATAEAGALDGFQQARANLVRGHVAFASGLGSDAPPLLLAAAQRLEPFDLDLARETYLDAWGAALFAGRLATTGDLLEVSRAARAAPPPTREPRPSDLLLDGLATMITEGRAAAAPTLSRAASAFAAEDGSAEENFRWGWLTTVPSNLLWDDETMHAINVRQLRRAREVGAVVRLPIDLTALAVLLAWWGDFAGAASAIAEADAVTEATGTRMAPFSAMLLAALRGREAEATSLIESTIDGATAGGQGIGVQFARWVSAILFNGFARYEDALAAAQEADDDFDLFLSCWALPELIEASVKSRKTELGRSALERLAEATTAARTDWALGIETRCRALLSDGATADELYREALDRFGRSRFRPELARTHLLYGEWLRRQARRADAREQLRTAHDLCAAIGMEAFAERARRELVATGEKVRKRSAETRDRLTPQEEQIARLARDGLSNPEIGAQLFISARTVEWHLRKVFTKLEITSRRQLRTVLSADDRSVALA
jgi:DNA-binding CsgD family transcriptional regulator